MLVRAVFFALLWGFVSACQSRVRIQVPEIESILYSDTDSYQDVVIDPVETQPEFPGGEDSLLCFLQSNLDVEILNTQNKKGRIATSFVIETDGTVTDITMKRNPLFLKDSLIEEEITRVFSLFPKWKPAMQRAEPVRSSFLWVFEIPYEFKTRYAQWEVEEIAKFRYKGTGETFQSIEKFTAENMNWPSQDDCVGSVSVQVLINEEGVLSDFTILRGLDGCRGFQEEALRLVKAMPKWIPAQINGKAVKSHYIIPIKFMLR